MRRYVADIYLNKLRTQVTVEARDQFEAERMIRAQYNVTGKILVSPDYKYEHALRDEEDRKKRERERERERERAREREREEDRRRAREREKKQLSQHETGDDIQDDYYCKYEIENTNNIEKSKSFLSQISSVLIFLLLLWIFGAKLINFGLEAIEKEKSTANEASNLMPSKNLNYNGNIYNNSPKSVIPNTSNTEDKKDTTLDKQPEISDGYPFGSKIHMNGGNNYHKSYHGFILNIKPHKEDLLVLNGQYDDVLEIYLEQADAGDINAMHNLGLMYIKGLGVNKDLQKGIEYLEKSAENRKWDADSVPLEKARKQLRNSESLQ